MAINTAAINNPQIISDAARMFGSSTITVSIEAIRQADGRYLAYTDNGREYTGVDAFEWAIRAAELGAGEILLTSVDREGTGLGYDIELTQKIANSLPIPVIASGGVGQISHLSQVILEANADAVSLASLLHYDFIKNHRVEGDFSQGGNVEYLKTNKTFSKINPAGLAEIKNYLLEQGINCRNTCKKPALNV